MSTQLSAHDQQRAEKAAMEFVVASLLNYVVNLKAQACNLPYADVLRDFAATTDRHLQEANFREWPGSTPELVETIRAAASGAVARICSRAKPKSG